MDRDPVNAPSRQGAVGESHSVPVFAPLQSGRPQDLFVRLGPAVTRISLSERAKSPFALCKDWSEKVCHCKRAGSRAGLAICTPDLRVSTTSFPEGVKSKPPISGEMPLGITISYTLYGEESGAWGWARVRVTKDPRLRAAAAVRQAGEQKRSSALNSTGGYSCVVEVPLEARAASGQSRN